ncbi:hypothetical protein RGQ29_013707 [Quercus rubra]|uniref:Pentatricopeptide repeat-containing protein n=1 Tax=Quercus rubra TaxID=3512 RepID=A0AAN7IZN6_QUERU|nr:hypothetical protein RGQ29_013707 [Quercus rubra]
MEKNGHEPDAVTCGTILNTLCKIGKTDMTIRLLRKMEEGKFKANVVLYGTIIDNLCLCNFGRWREATTLLSGMVQRKVMPNVHTFNILVDALCKEGKLTEAKEVFDVMIQRGIEPNTVIYSSLIDGYCLQNKTDDAVKRI